MPTEESLKRYKRAYGHHGAPKAYKSQTKAELEKTLRRRDEEASGLRRQLKAETKRADDAEDLRDGVFGLTLQDLEPPEWLQRRDSVQPSSAHTPILFTSDFQFGEVVKRDEMDGMNEFNAAVFNERYDRMIRKMLQWCNAIRDGWGATYPNGVIYLRGGDAISGEIHQELSDTNDFGAVPAVRELMQIEREGIVRLRNHFGRVHVISIPGNHGRLTVKPRAKSYVATNFETILAWWLADSLKSEDGVSCEVPESGYARFLAEGWRFEMRHGDRMGAGGGQGWIGSPAPITKGHKKVRLDAATIDAPVDYVLTGHFHTSMKLPRGFANGSMVGYNEYARQLGLDPDSAKQWLLFAHAARVYGVELELSTFPRRQS